MSILVFDTETTGLPKKYDKVSPNTLHYWDSCRLVQLAWEIYESPSASTPIASGCYTIAPNEFTIPTQASAIHGITNAFAVANGHPISKVLSILFDTIQMHQVQCLVAHNIAFDHNVIASEMLRCKFASTAWLELDQHCTMLTGTKRGGRYPKLSILYERLVGPLSHSIQLHCAAEDTRLCAAIYRAQIRN